MSSHPAEEKFRYFATVVTDVRVGGESLRPDEHRELVGRRTANRHSRWRAGTHTGVRPLQRRA